MAEHDPAKDVWEKVTEDPADPAEDAAADVPDATPDAPAAPDALTRPATPEEGRGRRHAITAETLAAQRTADPENPRRRHTPLPQPAVSGPQAEPSAPASAHPESEAAAPALEAEPPAPAEGAAPTFEKSAAAFVPRPPHARPASTATDAPAPERQPEQPARTAQPTQDTRSAKADGARPAQAARRAKGERSPQGERPAKPGKAAPARQTPSAHAQRTDAAQAPQARPGQTEQTPIEARPADARPAKEERPAAPKKAAQRQASPARARRGRPAKAQPAPEAAAKTPPAPQAAPKPTVAAWERIASEAAGPPPSPGLSQWEPDARRSGRDKQAARPKRPPHRRRTPAQRFAACKRWLARASARTGDALYEIGYYAEYTLVRLGRALKHGGLVALRLAGKALCWVLRLLALLPVAILMMFGRLFWHLFSAVRNVHEIWYTRDPDKPGETWRHIFSYLGGGVVRHAHLVPDLLGWALPVLAGMVFVFTVRTVLNYQYVLQVSCNDVVLGYVNSADVVETAQQDVQNRIIYVDGADDADKWEIRPTYAIAINEDQAVLDADDVADAILATSGEEIVEATGFYLGGQFYGAITDRARLEQELEDIKGPYYTGEEGEYVSFVVEPELVDGVYLRSSVVDYSVISEMVHSQTAGEVRYTVVTGDTPSGIASAYGLTTAELVSMNPDVDIVNSLYPGDSLVVSQAVSFLQVQVTYRRTEQEEVPYSTVRTNTDELSFGFTRTKTAGVNGINECVYDYVYIDGVLQSKTLISTTVISEPVTEEILVGTQVRPGVTVVPSTGAYMWPIPGYTHVSRGFSGLYAHNGMDICGGYGTPIYASQGGVVSRALYTNRGYGIYVIIDHGGGYSTLYGHCSGLTVQAGDIVNQGDLIGYVGSTGNSTGNHCHFEVRIGGVQVNPAPYVGYG